MSGGAAVGAWLREAAALHRQGRIAEAERLYAQVLAVDPDNPDALHLGGVAARQSGRALQAVLAIARAAGRDPTLPGLHANLDLAVDSLGPAEAVVQDLQHRPGQVRQSHRQPGCAAGRRRPRDHRHPRRPLAVRGLRPRAGAQPRRPGRAVP